MNELENDILKKVKPSLKEKRRVKKTAGKIVSMIEKKMDLEYQPRIEGSVAKGTYLADPDIDIFVLFSTDVSKDSMEEAVLETGRDILNDVEERYAEHPYIHGMYDGYEVDIVPCYKIDKIEEMKSAVDRTPFHTDFIIEKLPDDKKDDVILLKAFLKGIGAYGAESKVWGFSGYLCELLVLHYEGFREVLKNALKWRLYTRIEIIPSEIDFEDPLVVIDPVDPNRNVASALSEEKMYLFMYASKRYLDEPSITFFLPNEIREKNEEELRSILESRKTELMGLKFPRPDVVRDNLYPQVQKALRNLNKQLEEMEFSILHSDYYVKEKNVVLMFELETKHLPAIEKHEGPPIWSHHTEKFREKYGEDVYLENNRLKVDRPRRFRHIEEAVTHIAERVNLGSDITPMIPDKMEYFYDEQLLKKEKELLTRFFDKTFPWER